MHLVEMLQNSGLKLERMGDTEFDYYLTGYGVDSSKFEFVNPLNCKGGVFSPGFTLHKMAFQYELEWYCIYHERGWSPPNGGIMYYDNTLEFVKDVLKATNSSFFVDRFYSDYTEYDFEKLHEIVYDNGNGYRIRRHIDETAFWEEKKYITHLNRLSDYSKKEVKSILHGCKDDYQIIKKMLKRYKKLIKLKKDETCKY